MRGKEIKYGDALVLTTGNRCYRGAVTVHPDNSIVLSLFFDNTNSPKVGDSIPILDILVETSSRQDLFFD